MRHHVPKIDDAVADVEAGIEEAEVVGMADAGLGPSIDGGSEIGGDVVKKIGSSQRAEGAAEAVASDEEFLAVEGLGLNQLAYVVAHCFVDEKEALMNGAAAENRAVGGRSEIEVVEPVLEVFGAAEGDDEPALGGVDAHPAKVQVWFEAARHG